MVSIPAACLLLPFRPHLPLLVSPQAAAPLLLDMAPFAFLACGGACVVCVRVVSK